MDVATLKLQFTQFISNSVEWASSPQFYAQGGLILLAVILAYSLAVVLKKHSPMLGKEPSSGTWLPLKKIVYHTGELIFPAVRADPS